MHLGALLTVSAEAYKWRGLATLSETILGQKVKEYGAHLPIHARSTSANASPATVEGVVSASSQSP